MSFKYLSCNNSPFLSYFFVQCKPYSFWSLQKKYVFLQKQLSLNIVGTIFPTKAIISGMKSRGEGIVVITGSISSILGIYGYSIYSSTKFALRGFAEALHMEVGSQITNMISIYWTLDILFKTYVAWIDMQYFPFLKQCHMLCLTFTVGLVKF